MSLSTEVPVLSHPRALFDALVSNIQDAILILDGRGAVVFENASASGILGPAGPTVTEGFGLERIHPEERDAVIRSFERTLAHPGTVARATYRFARADGEWQHLEAVAKNLLHDPEIQGVLITLRDVTERVHALEAAERAGRARDEFLSRMSHELRTPLHAVLGWAQLLRCEEAATAREAGEQIEAAGTHLLRLVEEALDLAALREGRIPLELRPVHLLPVLGSAVDLIRPLAVRKDIQILLPTGSPDGCVLADPNRLRQVLLNLLSNAVKYNRFAGEVAVSLHLEKGRYARIEVRDTGPGMPEEKLARLFERYERLGMESSTVEGSGLGLSISRTLVQMMNGTLGVESRPGDGALFWVRLPLAPCSPRSGERRILAGTGDLVLHSLPCGDSNT